MFRLTQKIRQSVAFGLLLVFIASVSMHHCHCDCLVLDSHGCQTEMCCSHLNDLTVPHFCVESKVCEQQPHKQPICPHCISKRLGYLPSPKIDCPKISSSPAWADGFPTLIVFQATASLTFCFAVSHSPPSASLFHLRI